MVLDERNIVTQILKSYNEITIVGAEADIIFFKLYEKEYGIFYPLKDNRTGTPLILIKNEERYNYPHILAYDFSLDKESHDRYRPICLYENNNVINFLQTYEDKIRNIINRLIELLSLSPLEIENEFQKEFLYYWNDVAEDEIFPRLYIGEQRVFKRMNAYKASNSEVRFVANEINLTDKDERRDEKKIWRHIPELPVFYIPIIDNRRIIPPTQNNLWDEKNILMIIKGKEYNRISHECYVDISQEKIKTKNIGLVFEMLIDGNSINFTTIITFKHANNGTLLDKLRNDISKVKIIKSNRVDYYYLCRQIGNDTSIIDKKILLVGAGSLGSYVAEELVKAGLRNLTIYDSDILEEVNLLRHNVKGFCVNKYKVVGTKMDLEMIHPEIHVKAVSKNIDKKTLAEEMEKHDLIIFTVGSSDVQLASNNLFMEKSYNKPVIYAWLEAGGIYSHLLYVNYQKQGCFECLFTDEKGNLINNKSNKQSDIQVEENRIRNGCGATRVAYGTEILLRTSSVLLNTVRQIFEGKMEVNSLIDIEPEHVVNNENRFIEGKCQCCSDKD